jgi:hypothetical protein
MELLNSSLPEREKSEERLANEAVVMLAAGTETAAWSKQHLLSQVAKIADGTP